MGPAGPRAGRTRFDEDKTLMLTVSGERLWGDLMAMAEIGATAQGGCSRLALSDEDRTARDVFAGWCRDAGCEVRWDAFGNIFARRAGAEDLPPVLFGSHLDTQPNGGRFDGVLGVLAGLEVIRTLNAANITTRRPLVLVNWTNEEGVRFAPGLTGSKGFVGKLTAEDAARIRGADGSLFGAEAARIGYGGDAASHRLPVHAYFELHIEQGPVLEQEAVSIGVVTGAQGVRWYEVEITGASRHAGTTPMASRSDAFAAAARFFLAARDHSLLFPELRFTVGRLGLEPNSTNTIPGACRFSIDLRHPDDHLLSKVEAEFRDLLARICLEERTTATMRCSMEVPAIQFDETCVRIVEAGAREAGLSFRKMPSGAMHDACSLAAAVPTAMIFVPCRAGISHDPSEHIEPAAAADGAQVLLNAVMSAAQSG